MNALLNGTGWGEAPTVELKYPEWMSGTYMDPTRQKENLTDAKANQAIGRSRRKARIAAYHKRNSKMCLVGLTATVALLVIVGTIWG